MLLNQNRIHGRLQSKYWKIPASRGGAKAAKSPLYLGLQKLSSYLGPPQPIAGSVSFIDRMAHVSHVLRKVDKCDPQSTVGMEVLKDAVKQSYELCTSSSTLTLEETAISYGFKPSDASAIKTMRRVDKVGRYWGLCKSIVDDSRRYPDLFTNVCLQYLLPFQAQSSKIAYIQGQTARCLVHAEMQLLVFYSLQTIPKHRKPRFIGVSKSCCYLCNLYIAKYGRFFVTKTHGRLYERWNFPDLCEYSPKERETHRRVLTAIDGEILARCRAELEKPGRRENPMGSWLTLPKISLLPPVPSTISSSSTGKNQNLSQALLSTQAMSNVHPSQIPETSSTSLTESTRLQYTAQATLLHTPSAHDSSNDIHRNGTLSSIASWEYPVERSINASSPSHAKIKNISFYFEIDGSSKGTYRLTTSTNENGGSARHVVNVEAMKPGEERKLARDTLEDAMVLHLRCSQERCVQLILQWE